MERDENEMVWACAEERCGEKNAVDGTTRQEEQRKSTEDVVVVVWRSSHVLMNGWRDRERC